MMLVSMPSELTRRRLLGFAAGFAASAAVPTFAQSKPRIDVYRTSGCSCCLLWVKHLERAGFVATTKDLTTGELMRMKLDAGLKPDMTSCHTAKVASYTIEGHVPIREIERLLRDKPDVAGLTVPGMPIGSPGMESGAKREAYDVIVFRKDGTSEVYESYAARSGMRLPGVRRSMEA